MSLSEVEVVKRLFSQFSRELLEEIAPEDRARFQPLIQQRAMQLAKAAAGSAGNSGLPDLFGLSSGSPTTFDMLGVTSIEPDFDDAVIPTQLHAAAELYYIYQHERMKVFSVAGMLLRLFHEGRMRIQRGPGARALYLLEKHEPLRYKLKHRLHAYRRVFNYGKQALSPGAVVYRDFHRQFVAFNSALAQYFRDLLIGEVIRGSQLIGQRPFGSQATIERLGTDLRWRLDRATYGNIVALTLETSEYLKTILDALETADIKKAFDANNKWDVVEIVSQRYLGGAKEISQRTKMAETGRALLNFVADNPFRATDFQTFQAMVQPLGSMAESWIAAYRMAPEGRGFRGVNPALKGLIGGAGAPRAA